MFVCFPLQRCVHRTPEMQTLQSVLHIYFGACEDSCVESIRMSFNIAPA